jgi:hypothetical protein
MQESAFAIQGVTRQLFIPNSLLSTLDNFTAQRIPLGREIIEGPLCMNERISFFDLTTPVQKTKMLPIFSNAAFEKLMERRPMKSIAF